MFQFWLMASDMCMNKRCKMDFLGSLQSTSSTSRCISWFLTLRNTTATSVTHTWACESVVGFINLLAGVSKLLNMTLSPFVSSLQALLISPLLDSPRDSFSLNKAAFGFLNVRKHLHRTNHVKIPFFLLLQSSDFIGRRTNEGFSPLSLMLKASCNHKLFPVLKTFLSL